MTSPASPSRASAEPSVVVRRVDGRRIVSRTNPEISYAYGAPASSTRRSRANGSRGAGALAGSGSEAGDASPPLGEGAFEGSMSPPLPPPPDARSRYAALREKQQPTRKNAKRTETVGITSPPSRISRAQIDSTLDDVGESRSNASQSKASIGSAGRSRAGLNAFAGRFNSFYMDQPSGGLDREDVGKAGSVPSSLLLGAQRPSQHLLAASADGSIHSSDAGDSRSHDYAEEARQASQLAREAGSGSLLSSLSPSSWFKSHAGNNGTSSSDLIRENPVTQTSQARRRRSGRVSEENLAYRPSEGEDDSASDLSGEDRKHSRRGARKSDQIKQRTRDGRDDNKIWMASRKRRSKRRKDAHGNAMENGEEDEDDDEDMDVTPSDDEVEEIIDSSLEGMPDDKFKDRKSLKRKRNQGSSSKSSAALALRPLVFAGAAALAGSYFYLNRLPIGLPDLPEGLAQRAGPQSLADAANRIVKLETAYEALRAASMNNAKEETLLAARVANVEASLSKATSDFSASRAATEERVRKAESESLRIGKALEDVRARLVKVKDASTAEMKAEAQSLQKRINVLETSLQASDRRLSETTEIAKKALASTETLRAGLLAIEKSLPQEVAVQTERRTGAPVLDASTLQELRKIFVKKGDIAELSWDKFAAANDKAIRATMSSVIAEEAKAGSTIVGRSLFLDLLREELEKAKVAMESRFNENAQDIQNEILAKVRSQQEMYERAGSWTKPNAANQDHPIVLKDGTDARGTILTLIDAALEKYSADRIALRDFALYTAGGRVIPSHTSPTYRSDTNRSSFMGRVFGRSGGAKKTTLQRHMGEGHPPVVALYPDNTPGMCWAFQGEEGQLGISLSRRVVVSDITLEHAPSSISLEAGSSAPRDVTVWGIVERSGDIKRLAEFRQSQGAEEAHTNNFASADEDGRTNDVLAAVPPSDRHLLLASITYDAFASRAVQTFPISHEAKALNIPVAAVQVRVSSNHGNPDFTCIYRVRVHGREWTVEDEQASRT